MEKGKNPVQETVDQWIGSWNEKNLEKILENYADTAELFDPKTKEVIPEKFTLEGKNELRKYFSVILNVFPEINIKPLGLWIKGHNALLEYYIYTSPETKIDVISKFYLNKDYKIQGHFIYYGLSYKEMKEEKSN
ncbi:nuclear transport factor 2 family protein [Persephonella sp.]